MLASIDALLLAGLSWDPAIKGILTVLVGGVVLFGSVYLILATNTGARLGMLLSLASLFGFMSILTAWWWIQPPGMGPKGMDPSWHAVEVYYHQPDGGQGQARTQVLNQLPPPSQLPSAVEVIERFPELEPQLIASPENTTLSDIASIDATNDDGTRVRGADILKREFGLETTMGELVEAPDGQSKLNGWKLVDTAASGDAAAAVDAALVEQGVFSDATEYKRLSAFEWNEERQLADACPDAVSDAEERASLIPRDPLCRLVYRITDTFSLWHPPRFMVIQVQPTIAQETVPGQPPPTPRVDPSQPVMSVVLLRDEGNVRAKPAYFFAICFSLFIVFVLMLHYREKTLRQNLDDAEVARRNRDRELESTGSR